MSSIVMTIYSFDHSYAGLSASEIQSSSCHHIFSPGRRAGNLFINETGIRRLRTDKGKRHGDMWQQTANPNFNLNLNEVIL
jgi:hypothetical protein